MKKEFKFTPGTRVKTKSGLNGVIAICGVTSRGIQYLVRGTYAEQWTKEKDIEPEEVAPEPDETKED